MKNLFGLIILFIMASLHSQAQIIADTIRYVIETSDKNEFIGNLISQDKEFVVIETEFLGELKIPRTFISSMKKIVPEDMYAGEYWFDNPHATRYFYSPNGYNLKKDEAYYQNTWVVFNQLSYGITDNISIGTGLIPLFLFGGGIAPAWITPKIGFPVIEDKLNVGVGVLAATVIGEGDASFGIAYGTVTHGSRDKNSTLGIGWAYSEGGLSDYPTLSFSAMSRFSKKGYFITENYLISTKYETIGLMALGGRSVQKKLAIDYGLVFPINTGADVFLAIPWLSITIPFGNAVE
ncbi:MAG: hypothetical protein K9H58_19960 [Bacteroidales bacterium]|nr:hypothetical protein [Bacteroidales bacterium]